ncbi:MAG: hypothetical protein R3Y45_06825 [Bacillota bacterium]
MSYSRKEILKILDDLNDYGKLYDNPIINYANKTNDTEEYCTEVVAEWLLNHIDVISDAHIEQITREKSYKTASHTGSQTTANSNREEEMLAKNLFVQYMNCPDKIIGKMIDYQTPLKNKQTDKAGKIDIISFNEKTNMLFLLELKRKRSGETLLRCILEIITYYFTIDINKLCKDFCDASQNIENPVVVCAPIVIENSAQYQEYQDTKDGKRPKMKELIDVLKTKIELRFFTVEVSTTYSVSEFTL